MQQTQGRTTRLQTFVLAGWLIAVAGLIGLILYETQHIPALDYAVKAATAWFLGFVPVAEIIIAVPGAMALELSLASAIIWPILGNLTPIILIDIFYDQMMRWPWLSRWLDRLATPSSRARMDRWGVWAVLLLTPWMGVWVTAMTAQLLGMDRRRLLLAAGVSIGVYAVITALAFSAGVAAIG
ncbi:MAG: small multi-drug export protein [Chloroflexota bacterium]